MLKAEGFTSSLVGPARALLLAGAALWSLQLGWEIAGTKTQAAPVALATGCFAVAAAIGAAVWASLFWRIF